MFTKLDYKRAQEKERETREKNLKALNNDLEEAKELLSTIRLQPRSFEAEQDMRTVLKKIDEINDLIDSEQSAYYSTFAAYDSDIERAAEILANAK